MLNDRLDWLIYHRGSFCSTKLIIKEIREVPYVFVDRKLECC